MNPKPPADAEQIQQAFLDCILGAQRKAALDLILDTLNKGYSIPDIYLYVFQEVLYRIGQLWESNQITVADEHMGTAITQFVMSNLYQHLEMSDMPQGNMVITGVQGELHQVGANMVADVLEADGWNVMFLGANVPPDGVLQSIAQHEARVVGISSTMRFNLPKVIALVEAARSQFGDTLQFLLGGGAFRGLSELPPPLIGCRLAVNLYDARLQVRDIQRLAN